MNEKNINLQKIIISFLVIILSSLFLFYNLGHYALWDDEAETALFAKSIWQTGDMNAIIDHNIVAYNEGKGLTKLHMRYIPPLQSYIAAPFTTIINHSNFWLRFPFAFCGLLSIILILFWLYKSKSSQLTWLLTSIGLLGNVSFFLFFRQCRYYGPTILFSLIILFLYTYRNNHKKTIITFSLISFLLFTSNYLCFLATFICLSLDYLFWGRKTKPLKTSIFIGFLLPLIFSCGIILFFHNPLIKNMWGINSGSWILNKLTLFAWNFRDLNSCEFGVGLLILLSPFLYLFKKDINLIRCPVAIVIYCISIALFSPQPNWLLKVANVRYLMALIPLCIFTSVLVIKNITNNKILLSVILAIIAFCTNMLNGGPFVGKDKDTNFSKIIERQPYRSSILEFTAELIHPHSSSYEIVSSWIKDNIDLKETIWVNPQFATYPLMHYAPKPIYGWQLNIKKGQFKELPDIYFKNKIQPDYIIAFGPNTYKVKNYIQKMKTKNISYKRIKKINNYWYDLTRPELFWHSFEEINNFSLENESISIFKRID